MAPGRNNFGFLVKKIGSCMLEDFEFFTHAKCTFTIRGVESGTLLYGAPRNVVRSTEVLDVPYFFRQASVRFVFDDVEGFLVISESFFKTGFANSFINLFAIIGQVRFEGRFV